MASNNCIWTDADRNKVAAMIRDGKTSSQIGAVMGLTRNATVGRISRDKMLHDLGVKIGLYGVRGTSVAAQRRKQTPQMKAQNMHVARPKLFGTLQAPTPTAFACRAVPMVDLASNECRWPVNNAAIGERHLFCGNKAEIGAYCQQHYQRLHGNGTAAERAAHKALVRTML